MVCNSSDIPQGNEYDYCIANHYGPLCESCKEENKYFSRVNDRCVSCPNVLSRVVIGCTITLLGAAILISVYVTVSRSSWRKYLQSISIVLSRISLQAKIKIVVSFLQIVAAIEPVYGVRIHKEFKNFFRFLILVNFNLSQLIPGGCIGAMKKRIMVSSLWPFALIIMLYLVIIIYSLIMTKIKSRGLLGIQQSIRRVTLCNSRQLWAKLIYITVVILYFVLPSVSNSIFDAIICRAFKTSDEEDTTRSYLVADWSILCDIDNTEFNSLRTLFWTAFTIWPILVPLIFVILLITIRKSVRAKRTTLLTDACRFLWRDYKESMLFWEVFEIYRRLILTGLVNLIELEEGSTRILRMVAAIMVSALHLGILALARPYMHNNDLNLAFASNVIIICFFSTGIMIHVCQDDDSCERYIGDSIDSFTATSIAVIMTSIMLVTTIVSIVYISINSIAAPTIRIISTGNIPNMEVPSTCQNHVFLSHKWSTCQEKVHTLVRMLQLYLQGVRVWLDVDDLEDIAKLEESVQESAVFCLFYTDGYFASTNCRREIYAAVKAKKPIVTVYVNDSTAIEDMKTECETFCTEDPGSHTIIEKVLANDPILWLGNNQKVLALASIKLFALSFLHHLPYYQTNPAQLVRGLRIGREPNPERITRPLVIYTCNANGRAKHIAEEIKSEAKETIQLRDTMELSQNGILQNAAPNSDCEVLLLYLNKDLFKDQNGEVSKLVELSLKKGMKPVLVYEQDAVKGKCEFTTLYNQTPDVVKACGIFNELAIPMYTIPAYRTMSLYLLLQKMSDTCSST